MLTQDGRVHFLDTHAAPAAALQQSPQFANVETDTPDKNVAAVCDDEIDLIAGVDVHQIPNSLRNRHLSFTGHGRGRHSLLLSEF